MALDPWAPVISAIAYTTRLVAWAAGYSLLGEGAKPVEYESEPEPRWMLCPSCGHSTVHLPHFWVADGDTDWECDQCGSVTSG